MQMETMQVMDTPPTEGGLSFSCKGAGDRVVTCPGQRVTCQFVGQRVESSLRIIRPVSRSKLGPIHVEDEMTTRTVYMDIFSLNNKQIRYIFELLVHA